MREREHHLLRNVFIDPLWYQDFSVNQRLGVRFRSTSRGEYSIWATRPWKRGTFGRMNIEQTFQTAFSKHFLTFRIPNQVLTPSKSASKRTSEMFVHPSKIFVWDGWNLCSPNEDFGNRNKRFGVSFCSSFQRVIAQI